MQTEAQAVIEITLMGEFSICVNGQRVEQQIGRAYKGVLLLQTLIIQLGEPVLNSRLWSLLWPDEEFANPENALKTLVSRLRTQLRKISPALADAIVTERGAYRFQKPPEMWIDLYRIEEILRELDNLSRAEAIAKGLCDELMRLYQGDLMQFDDTHALIHARAASLHSCFVDEMRRCVQALDTLEEHERVVDICRRVMEVDRFNEQACISMMNALMRLGRTAEAIACYKEAERVHHQYLDIHPSEELQAFYKQLIQSGRTNRLDLDGICAELEEEQTEGAYVCPFVIFKEGFNILMRNIDRKKCPVVLAAVSVGRTDGNPLDMEHQARAMHEVRDALQISLKEGDMITRFSALIAVALMPVTSMQEAEKRIEAAKMVFYKKPSNAGLLLTCRLREITGPGAA